MSRHSVFVLSCEGTPLTPTTPARARHLLQAGVARPVWSRLGTFGIRLLGPTRCHQARTGLGVDHGAVAEGYAVVCGTENVLAVKLDLADKAQVVRKLEKRRLLRRARRARKLRRRPKRCQNRRRSAGWIAPSQRALVLAREKMLTTLARMYPLTVAEVEEVCFDHRRHRWGAPFSTVEIGKERLRQWYHDHGINARFYRGFETEAVRTEYGYTKTSAKRANRFSAHCTDALALAAIVTTGERVEPGPWLIADDTYRPVRRQLHDTKPSKRGMRAPYSRGTVRGLRKGLLLQTNRGQKGCLCGVYRHKYRYYDQAGKRHTASALAWVCSNYHTTEGMRA
jgi:RRXRR protein